MQDSSEAIKLFALERGTRLSRSKRTFSGDAAYLDAGQGEGLGLSLVGEKAINRISFRLHGRLEV